MESKKKAAWLKIAVVIVIVLAVIYGWKTFTANDAQQQQQQAAAVDPIVIVEPVKRADASLQDSEYVGTVEAIQTVEVKPEISGKIASVNFKEGSLVKAGQTLFQIEPEEFRAKVALCQAELARAKANLVSYEKYYARVQAAEPRAVSASERDNAECNVLQGKAAVAQAEANLSIAKINLGYCTIKAPITGKIGIAKFTKGNYVTPSSGPLATIVQMDPVRISYPLPDRDYLDQLEYFNKEGAVYKTKLVLSNGTQLNVSGQRDFEDNMIDQNTGTVMVRIRYSNDGGMLIPGEMVRVFTQPVKGRIVNVIPQTAIMVDNKGDYVYVAEADNTIRMARIKLGREMGYDREVTEGLKAGERVVTAGLQNIRPGVKVRIEVPASSDKEAE
ncbi:MAG: efflux RND transporter periplasmic adaptor subunit [Synergistes sp.]|nr:efflux RND transporter periplasmic adaptor subunit [Synergistes sp.]